MNFNDRNFNEALRLAEEARKDQIFAIKNKKFDVVMSPKILIERMQITTKLSFLIAWFFYQKAIENEELGAEELFDACPSLCANCPNKNCVSDNGCFDEEVKIEQEKHYSIQFVKLKKECNSLYCRVARIDNMVRNKKTMAV